MSTPSPASSSGWKSYLPLLNYVLTFLLIGLGLWFLSGRLNLSEVAKTLVGANLGFTIAAVIVMVMTIALKSWRWQLMFTPRPSAVSYNASFWATSLGQYVNLVVPFLRLGEVARIYALNQESGIKPAQTIGTLVVEKALDLLFFGLTILIVVPFIALPDFVQEPGPFLLALPLLFSVILYILAFQTARVLAGVQYLADKLPAPLDRWLITVAANGLEGLASLRSARIVAGLVVLSMLIAVLGVVLPFLLFPALNIHLTWLDAALIHIVVSLAIAPPSTPVKIGVFNVAAAAMLWQLGVTNETVVAGYAILLYLVVIVPQIFLGIVAAARTKWRWNMGITQPSVNPTMDAGQP